MHMRRIKVGRLAGIIILAACVVGVVNARAAQAPATRGNASDVSAKQAGPQKRKTTSARRNHTSPKDQSKVTTTKTATNEVSLLKQQIATQQKQINQLLHAVAELNARLQGPAPSAPAASAALPSSSAKVASLVPTLPPEPQAHTSELPKESQQLERQAQPAKAAQTTKLPSSQFPESSEVASLTPVLPPATAVKGEVGSSTADEVPITSAPAMGQGEKQEGIPESPLQFHIGSAYITPVGFMDFTNVWRSHDGGTGIGTNFASIPYGNVFQNNLSEFRLSMQNSRVGFRVDANVEGAHVVGYMESDFLGLDPGNVAVTSNSNALRSRLYWVDVRKSKWELLGGQTWSLITPGRSGISPLPADVFFTQNMDVNYQLGLFWGRIPELRVVYHPSSKAAFAVALDSPEQYVGGSAGGGLITFPSALASTYANELNVGTNTLGVPNVAPDVIAKLALDPSSKFHFEIGGVERNFKLWNPLNSRTYSATGGGGFVNFNFQLFKGFRVLTNNFWSDGGGRYIFGQAPDLIVRADGSPSLIHASSTVTGFEYTHHNTLLFGYYGGLYVGRNVAIDTNGKPIGYGYTGAPNGQNRAVQEATLGFNHTLWNNPRYGGLQFIGQYSYVTRNPWYIATGQPNNASLNMVFFDLRYVLPGTAPARGQK